MHSKQWSKTCKRLYCIFICIKNYCQCRLYSLTWFLRVILDYDFTIEEIMFIRQNKKLSTGYPICLSLKSMRRIGRREKSVCVGRGEGRQRDTYCMLKVWDGRKEEERENTSSVETVVLRHSVPPKHSTTYATSYKTFCQINIYKRKREKKSLKQNVEFQLKISCGPVRLELRRVPWHSRVCVHHCHRLHGHHRLLRHHQQHSYPSGILPRAVSSNFFLFPAT